MPEIITTIIPAIHTQIGDLATNPATGNQMTVGAVDAGTKWTVARTDSGAKIFRLGNMDEITVQREVKTDEEKAAERAAKEALWATEHEESRSQNISRWVESAVAAMASASERFAKVSAEGRADYNDYDAIMMATAKHRIAMSILHQMLTDGVSPVVAYDLWAEGFKGQMLAEYSHRSVSRSTSVTSNLLEDVAKEVGLSILNNYRFAKYAA